MTIRIPTKLPTIKTFPFHPPGQSVNGHRVLIQLLALEHPEFCVSSIQKSVSLMNSYQNRPPIGLTLLWAVGLGGVKDFTIGLKGN